MAKKAAQYDLFAVDLPPLADILDELSELREAPVYVPKTFWTAETGDLIKDSANWKFKIPEPPGLEDDLFLKWLSRVFTICGSLTFQQLEDWFQGDQMHIASSGAHNNAFLMWECFPDFYIPTAKFREWMDAHSLYRQS